MASALHSTNSARMASASMMVHADSLIAGLQQVVFRQSIPLIPGDVPLQGRQRGHVRRIAPALRAVPADIFLC